MQVNAIDGVYEPLEDLRAALDASGVVGTWDWDVVQRTVRYDQGAARLLAGDPDLAGQVLPFDAATAGIHPEDRGWLNAEANRAIAAGGLILAEYRVATEALGTRWLLSRGRVYQDPHGRPVRCKGILIDITESRDEMRGYLARTGLSGEDPASRAAACCLEARDLLAEDAPPRVGLLFDLLLFEIGRHMAERPRT